MGDTISYCIDRGWSETTDGGGVCWPPRVDGEPFDPVHESIINIVRQHHVHVGSRSDRRGDSDVGALGIRGGRVK